MSDPLFSNTVNIAHSNARNITAIERDWWNHANTIARENMLTNIDFSNIGTQTYETATENAYQRDYTANINQIINTNYDSLPQSIKDSITETLIVEGELPNPSVYKGIGQEYIANPQGIEKEVFVECDRCDEVFMADEDFNLHKSVDHGDDTTDLPEAEESWEFSMNPDINRYDLHEARKALAEKKPYYVKDAPDNKGDTVNSKYIDNPNEGLYDTKLFKKGKIPLVGYEARKQVGINPVTGLPSYKDVDEGGEEVLATEDYIPAPYDKHFRWVASMDQDDYVCNHCGKMMMYEGDALHTQSQNIIIDVVRQHLKQHGINEAKYIEEADNYTQKDFGTQKQWDEDLGDLNKTYGGKEADNYPQKGIYTPDSWDDELHGLKKDYQGRETEVQYDQTGMSDITNVPETNNTNTISSLENIDFSEENIDYVYPTKSNESRPDKSTDLIRQIANEYGDSTNESDDEAVEAQIIDRKLRGYQTDQIANELRIMYGVSHEDAYSKVASIEVSTNDKVANTFFGKLFSQCNEAERQELRLYSGSDY